MKFKALLLAITLIIIFTRCGESGPAAKMFVEFAERDSKVFGEKIVAVEENLVRLKGTRPRIKRALSMINEIHPLPGYPKNPGPGGEMTDEQLSKLTEYLKKSKNEIDADGFNKIKEKAESLNERLLTEKPVITELPNEEFFGSVKKRMEDNPQSSFSFCLSTEGIATVSYKRVEVEYILNSKGKIAASVFGHEITLLEKKE